MKMKLCVIGDPVEHSLSPRIQNAMIERLGLPFVYDAVRVEAGKTEAFLRRAAEEGYVGCNATMPHKTALVTLADELSDDARLFGAVNTALLHNGYVKGYNTDGEGFLRMLLDNGFSPAGRTITVLGAGGAARAIVLKLAHAGAARVHVCNRTVEKARLLAEKFPDCICAHDFGEETLLRCARDSELFVNATPMGMNHVSAQFASFSFLGELPKGALVCDAIYSPPETEFLRQARLLGYPTANGLGMLLHQAILALEKFSGVSIAPEDVMPAALEALQK